MKQIILFTLIISIVFSSCNNKKDERKITNNTKFQTGFAPRKSRIGIFMDSISNEEVIYFAEPVSKKKILFFDLKGNIKDSIDLKPIVKYLDEILTMSIFSKDSIVFYSYETITMINNDAKILKKINLPLVRDNGDINLFDTSYTSNFTNNYEKIVLSVDWKLNKNEGQKINDYYKYSYEKPKFALIEGLFEETNTIVYADGPILYKHIIEKPAEILEIPFYRQIDNKMYTFSKYSDKVFIFNIDDFSLIENFEINSDFTKIGTIPPKLDLENKTNSGQLNNEISQSKGRIGSLNFDVVKNEIYLLVYHEIEYNSLEDISLRPFSIIKYDENFNKLKEYPFTDGIYNGLSIQTTSKGLMLLNKKESTDEELQYDFFDF